MWPLISKSLVFRKIKVVHRFSTSLTDVIHNMACDLNKPEETFNEICDILGHSDGAKVRVEVLGSGAPGAPPSVYLFTENSRYLFNCGEGTQRLMSEFKVKMSKISHIFMTYPSWRNISGLIGITLSAQSAQSRELYVYGHNHIGNVISAARKFIDLKKLSVYVKECNYGEEFDDNIINVKYVPLHSSVTNIVNKNLSEPNLSNSKPETQDSSQKEEAFEDFSDDETSYYNYSPQRNKDKKEYSRNVKKEKNRSQSEMHNKSKESSHLYAVSYICRSKPTLGKLDIDKCIDLGLEPGPLLGKLKSGEDIQLKNGETVKSCDVKSPDIPGAVIIVVECPTEDFLDSLLKEPAFFRHQSDAQPDDIASVVVHFTAPRVVKNPKYEEWINRFSKDTKHLFVNEENKGWGAKSVYRQQYFLNQLHSDIFPLLPTTTPPFVGEEGINNISENSIVDVETKQQFPNSNTQNRVFYKCTNTNYIRGETQCQLVLRPAKPYDYSYPELIEKDFFVKEALSVEGLTEEIEKLKIKFNEMKELNADKREFPKILFLGTGSSQPNRRRNCSGILVHLDEKNLMLLDCGEGTCGQIIRFFGSEKAKEILRNINNIFISHLHADHHSGLVTLLKQRKLAFDEICEANSEVSSSQDTKSDNTNYKVLNILAPVQIIRWLNLFSTEFENLSGYFNLVPNLSLSDDKSRVNFLPLFREVNLKEIKTTLVRHCRNAFGVSILHNDGWKLTYSGDTLPCDELINLGKNSDVLIHEATMDDSLAAEAAYKHHSTTKEAIGVGKKMNAKFTLLTHFSQRYAHIPYLDDNSMNNVGFAFDNMLVSINQLPLLPMLDNVLKIMFSEHHEKLESIRESRELKKKRQLNSPERPAKQMKTECI